MNKSLLLMTFVTALAVGCAGNQFQQQISQIDLEPLVLTGKVLLAEHADQFTETEYALLLDAIDAAVAYQAGGDSAEIERLIPRAVDLLAVAINDGDGLDTNQKMMAIGAVTAAQLILRDQPELIDLLSELAGVIASLPVERQLDSQ